MTKLNIIDVSTNNGVIDWGKTIRAVDGVVIRAGYRGVGGALNTDKNFIQNVTGAIAAGARRIGVYWWTTHTTTEQAKADAAYLIKFLEPYRDSVNFGVWLESEPSGSDSAFNRLSARARTNCALAFLSAVAAAGYQVGVYASDSWFDRSLNLSRLRGVPLWVAWFSTDPPKAVKDYTAWQYNNRGSVAGVTGAVNESYFYQDLSASQANRRSGEVHDMDTLRQGDRGQQVRVLQKLLGGDLVVDGIFGPLTKAATEEYQRKQCLTVDGIVGPKTWGKLLES